MKTHLLILFLLLFASAGVAQERGKAVSESQRLRLLQSYSGTRWMMGDKILKKKELRKLLSTCPASAGAYRIHKKNRILTNTIITAAVGLYVSSLFVLSVNEDVSLGMLVGSAAAVLGTIPISVKADRSLHTAVRLYNKAVLDGDTTRLTGLSK